MFNEIAFMEGFSVLGISIAVLGFLILIIVRDQKSFHFRLGLACFVCGCFATVYSFLYLNPDWLETLRENLAIALIGLVIATISVIKIIRK